MSNNDYHNLPEKINEDIIKRASRLSSAQLCDGMIGLGVHRDGCMDAEIMPVQMSMKVIGTAYTVETSDGNNFPIHVAIYQGRPGYVLIIDGKANSDHPYMGDLMVSASKAIGLEGIVIDGYVRDRETLSELGYPVFSRGFMQRGPLKTDPGAINTTIKCAGVTVNPGDLIVGDADGVTVVPRDLIEKVIEKAEKKDAYEIKRREVINTYAVNRANGLELPEIAPTWVLEMLKK